jgi:hypothetical protein
VRAGQQWDDVSVTDYLVAAHADNRTASPAPEGKCHAYLAGARTTACGFGLDAMRRFTDLHFSLQPPEVRCPLCARVVGGNR